MRFIYLALVIIILVSVAIVLAEEPDRSHEINWCFETQPWGDGRCNNADPYINDYNWRMGWLMAHCELGFLPAEICFVPDNNVIVGGETGSYYITSLDGGITIIGSDIYSNGSLIINGSIPNLFITSDYFIGDIYNP